MPNKVSSNHESFHAILFICLFVYVKNVIKGHTSQERFPTHQSCLQTRKAYEAAALVAQVFQKTGEVIDSVVMYTNSALAPSSSADELWELW